MIVVQIIKISCAMENVLRCCLQSFQRFTRLGLGTAQLFITATQLEFQLNVARWTAAALIQNTCFCLYTVLLQVPNIFSLLRFLLRHKLLFSSLLVTISDGKIRMTNFV